MCGLGSRAFASDCTRGDGRRSISGPCANNPTKGLAVIPPNKDTDLKFYQADGTIQNGAKALGLMASDADLVLWVAGNQFFAMDEVVGAFQKSHPGVSVGLITLPPGLILSAIQGGGWIYDGKEYHGTPTSMHLSI